MQLGLLVLLATLPLHLSAQESSPRIPNLPWHTIEAESMSTNGSIDGNATIGNPAYEASGKKCVRLPQGGGYLSFVLPKAVSGEVGCVVRYSLPHQDGGEDQVFQVAVNDHAIGSLRLTSRYSHQFGAYPFTKNSADGTHRHFWDESNTVLSHVRSGDRITLSWKGKSELFVDLVDVEPIPRAVSKPLNALSLDSLGVHPNLPVDVTSEFTRAIAKAQSLRRVLYIPEGTYHVGGVISLDHVQIQGAGMWRTRFVTLGGETAPRITFLGAGNDIQVRDLSIQSNVTYRNDSEPNDGVSGSFGERSLLKNLWIEHSKVGMWLTNSKGLLIDGCRFRDTIADGINLCLGMQNTEVRNCTARGTGDDGFAMWPATYAPSRFEHSNNRFVDCTSEMPYLAQGFALYGGKDQSIIGCCAKDICYGPGFYISTTFPIPNGFSGTQTLSSNTSIGSVYPNAAIALFADHWDIPGVKVTDTRIIRSEGADVRFSSANGHRTLGATFENCLRESKDATTGAWFQATEGALGTVKITNSPFLPKIKNANPSGFSISLG